MALFAGLLFGAGLVLGGMTQPAVVLGFLDIFGQWNPQLVFVMGAAVVTTALGYRLVLSRARPWLDTRFRVPAVVALDRRLLGGAALFGMGWGLAGYCPGPALASIAGGNASLLLFVACMVAGWWLAAPRRQRALAGSG
ncbi:MAG: YeeE/YedE family protein [Xanthomonadales bacterium]|nr:YeeE/YedE family protein [Xanthomonadales bacterium]